MCIGQRVEAVCTGGLTEESAECHAWGLFLGHLQHEGMGPCLQSAVAAFMNTKNSSHVHCLNGASQVLQMAPGPRPDGYRQCSCQCLRLYSTSCYCREVEYIRPLA